jgi:hypothetical protein
VWHGRYSSLSPAARIQLVTARRPRANITPRNRRASRGADRGSRTAARAENQWHGAGVGCELASEVEGAGGRAAIWFPRSEASSVACG